MCCLRICKGHLTCRVVMSLACCVIMASCGTGIEVTEHVSDKDVQKVINQDNNHQKLVTLDPYVDSVPSWRTGKRFWVADDQVKLLFVHSQDYNLDTVRLAGRIIEYAGYDIGDIYDNRNTLNLKFSDSQTGLTYRYRSGKTLSEFNPLFSIPMLIDMDLVHHVARQIEGKDYYIRTPIWFNSQTEKMMDGRHFIQVHIDSVLPGNAVMPLRVLFTTADTHEHAMVWMSDNASTMHGRDFDAMFVANDPRQSYPDISDANWDRITRQQIIEGMTKTECRLALGNPKRINENPNQSGMREYWYYEGGSYLYFADGILQQFRR